MLLFVCIYQPFALVYSKGSEKVWEIVIDAIVWASFMIDIVINFNSAYFSKDVRLVDHHKVRIIIYSLY